MPTFQAADLIDLITDVFVAAETPEDIARYVAETLINANLMGHDSHGLIRAKDYIRQIRDGRLFPAARPKIKQQIGAVAVVDCQRGFGQISAKFGAELARDLARTHGIGAITLSECNHIGRLGEYAHLLAREKLVGALSAVISSATISSPNRNCGCDVGGETMQKSRAAQR
jgi:LDH2 family malate/lactate/ureidoglycolate dehydrogenase